jgi:hypothetical protein
MRSATGLDVDDALGSKGVKGLTHNGTGDIEVLCQAAFGGQEVTWIKAQLDDDTEDPVSYAFRQSRPALNVPKEADEVVIGE